MRRSIIVIVVVLLYSTRIIADSRLSFFDSKLSQGYVSPLFIANSIILTDKNGALYSFDLDDLSLLKWKLYFPHTTKKKISNISLSSHAGVIFFIVNNFLRAIDAKTGRVCWEKELQSPARGMAAVINDKLIILTIDNHLHAIYIKDGSCAWNYRNGITFTRGLYSTSHVIYHDMIISPFSNGEIIAFNEYGEKLWTQRLVTDFLKTQLTDITTTPKVLCDILVATNNSNIYGIDVKSGNILWSKQVQVRSISDITSYYTPLLPLKEERDNVVFVITRDNEIIGIDIKNGETFWKYSLIKNLQKNIQLFSPIMYANTLWVTSNKGLLFAFSESRNIKGIVRVSGNVFHAPLFRGGKIYVTTDGRGVYLLSNRFIYD